MSSFSSLLVDRGAVSLADLDAATHNQLLHGGDIGTNLLAIGALKENVLQRLLSDHHELPVGPQGRLPELDAGLEELLPKAIARRYRVHPLKRTRRTLHVASAGPLAPEVERELRGTVGLQLRVSIVTPVRLAEALRRDCALPPSSQVERVLADLDSAERGAGGARRPVGELAAASAAYRRMSERPEGIRPSVRQARVHVRREPETIPPATLDGVGPAPAAAAATDRPMRRPTPPPPSLSRITSPSEEPADEADGGAQARQRPRGVSMPPRRVAPRETSPWTDSPDSIDELPVSIRTEFTRSLPPAGEPSADMRTFRHRGPFTRPQAELAASQAHDVSTVLEIVARFARQFFERTMLLAVHGQKAEARVVHGIAADLGSLRIDLSNPSLFRRVFVDSHTVVDSLGYDGADAVLRAELGLGDTAAPVAIVPLCIRDRVVAMVYGDDAGEPVDPDAVHAVATVADVASAEIARVILTRKQG